MSNTAPSRADPVVVFPLGRWCPPQETSQPHPPPSVQKWMNFLQGEENEELQQMAPEERKAKAQDITQSRILTQAEFRKIRVHQLGKEVTDATSTKTAAKRGKKRKADGEVNVEFEDGGWVQKKIISYESLFKPFILKSNIHSKICGITISLLWWFVDILYQCSYLTLNMLNYFEYHNRYIYISYWVLFNRRRPDSQCSNPTCCVSYTINTMPADALAT